MSITRYIFHVSLSTGGVGTHHNTQRDDIITAVFRQRLRYCSKGGGGILLPILSRGLWRSAGALHRLQLSDGLGLDHFSFELCFTAIYI